MTVVTVVTVVTSALPSNLCVCQLKEEFDLPYMTKCDGESILHLYAHGGIDFAAKHLDGVFAFVLLDVEKQKVFVGRDLYGVRPCFRTVTPAGVLAVSSEGKGQRRYPVRHLLVKCCVILLIYMFDV